LQKDNNLPHIPVLLNETINSFKDIKEGIFVDCTLGYGGHSVKTLKNYPHINLIGIDRDLEAINFSKERLKEFKDRVKFLHGPFSQKIKEIDFSKVTGLLADFGVSSLQFDKLNRGFSFDSEVLDMRMDQTSDFSAKEVVNFYPQNRLEKIFKDYGEVKNAKKIANAIVNYRANKKINSAKELADLIAKNSPKKGKIHPATLVFQAIRIEVNKELDEITTLLDFLEEKKPKGAIVSFITFHSLEDRLIKNRFKKWAKSCICPQDNIKCICGNNNELGVILNKKPITASKDEIAQNPRSRSAKLRSFKFKG